MTTPGVRCVAGAHTFGQGARAQSKREKYRTASTEQPDEKKKNNRVMMKKNNRHSGFPGGPPP